MAFFFPLPGHRCAIFEDSLRSSFSIPDQVPVVPADGAVAAAVDPSVVAPPAPADAAGDNNVQNANDNVVPAPQPAAPEASVFSCPCIRFPSRVFRARRCWSFSLVLAFVLLVLVFAFVLLV